MKRYDVSDKYGYILEAKACEVLLTEFRKLHGRLQAKISKQEIKRKSEFEKAMSYKSEREIQDDYGYGVITEKQYDHYRELLEKGQEALSESVDTKESVAFSILNRIIADIDINRRQLEFDALSPEEQAEQRKKAEKSQKEWKKRIAEIKRKREMEIK